MKVNCEETLEDIVEILDVDKFQEALANGASVKVVETSGVSLLLLCLKSGMDYEKECFAMMNELILENADLNFVDQHKQTPLNFCITNYNMKFAELLIRSGANVCKPSNGETPLSLAVKKKDYDLITFLLKNEANLSVNSALKKAIEIKDEKSAKLLLDNASGIIEFEENCHLSHAVKRGLLETVRLILQIIKDDTSFLYLKDHALYKAAKRNHLEIIKLLIENGASITWKAQSGSTPFTKIIENQNYKAIQYVFSQEAILKEVKKCIHENHILTAVSNYDLRSVRLLSTILPVEKHVPVIEKIEELAEHDEDIAALNRCIISTIKERNNKKL